MCVSSKKISNILVAYILVCNHLMVPGLMWLIDENGFWNTTGAKYDHRVAPFLVVFMSNVFGIFWAFIFDFW